MLLFERQRKRPSGRVLASLMVDLGWQLGGFTGVHGVWLAGIEVKSLPESVCADSQLRSGARP
jgi:hypothetical protein